MRHASWRVVSCHFTPFNPIPCHDIPGHRWLCYNLKCNDMVSMLCCTVSCVVLSLGTLLFTYAMIWHVVVLCNAMSCHIRLLCIMLYCHTMPCHATSSHVSRICHFRQNFQLPMQANQATHKSIAVGAKLCALSLSDPSKSQCCLLLRCSPALSSPGCGRGHAERSAPLPQHLSNEIGTPDPN